MALMMDREALQAFLPREFPEVGEMFDVLDVSMEGVRVALDARPEHLRPGGTVSGPTMFALVDVGTSNHCCILQYIG